jgi:hypothetical protein
MSHSAQNYEITTLIINEIDRYPGNSFKKFCIYIQMKGFSKIVSVIFFRLIRKLEEKVMTRKQQYQHFYDKFDLSEHGFDTIRVIPTISNSGLVFRYNQSDLEKIRKANLNLIVRAGTGILRGEILTTCPNGIISFHHADNNINRGGPAGFWEVYEQLPKTGFIIQRLTDELDAGDVLYKGFIRTSWFYSLNLANLQEISNPFFCQVLEDLTSSAPTLKAYPKIPYSAPLYTTPKIRQTIYYVFKTAAKLLVKKTRKLSGKRIRWGVAYQFTESWSDVALWRSAKILNPKNRFLADPFLVKRNDKHYCFVEDFDYSTNRGCISAYEITKDGHTELGAVLLEDFHLSYPYLFEYDGELYMCPETNQKNDIRLYRCVEFPMKWEFHRTIMTNVSAADTQIFFYGNKWWLISNIDISPVGEHCSQLHIFYNSSPLSKDWIPHNNNPVIFDPLKARNGGLICNESGIFRVYQRQGFDVYGQSLGVAKITTLDTEKYAEEVLFEIEPNFFSKVIGTHTYNYADGLLVFDYSEISKKRTGASSLKSK